MAQIIFTNIAKRNSHKGVVVRSAGVATSDGIPMMPTAIEALIECGEKLGRKNIVSTRFSYDMLKKYDHIVTMTEGHARSIGDYANVYSLGNAIGAGDVNDPFMQGREVYEETCKELQEALEDLYIKIAGGVG